VVESSGGPVVKLLGPFEVFVGDRPVTLTTGRLRALLAVLAMSAGRSVPVDRLASALWGNDLPANSRRAVQLYVTRLRTALGTAMITTGPSGYTLCTKSDNVDALRFLRLREAATADPATERVRLDEALALWRGTPFDGVPAGWLSDTQRPRLQEHYLTAVERRIDLDLSGGQHRELVPELAELAARHPLRESLWVRLLVALDRCGRQAEALERYETIRVRLADQLGTDPGPELRRAHADLLAGTPLTTAARPTGPARTAVPRQLPPDLDGFTGRHTPLKAMRNLLGAAPDRPRLVAISGTAGVGKTTLAVHWAYQITDRFPDGQLYVNLRGFGHGDPIDPGTILRGFLDALGTPAHRVPADLSAQTGLYRSLLAGKRVLVLLDNARDAEQVRPLLPGSPSCLVVVTSRNQLTSLIATDSAHPVILGLMPVGEARELLARRLGEHRVAAEPAPVDTIIAQCARLPLALAVAAARAAIHPEFPLAALAGELGEARENLDAFDGIDSPANVRSVFSWSYRTLSPPAARLFRLLGLATGPDLGGSAAASLAGVTVPRVRPLLAELCRAHLLTEHAPGRYSMHDLLHAYAVELTRAHDSEPDRRAATHRFLDYYLHTAHLATTLLYPQREPIPLPARQTDVEPDGIAGHEQARAWFTTELLVLLGALDKAAVEGFDAHAWRLAWSLVEFLDRRGQWRELIAAQLAGAEVARRLGERAGAARAHRDLARASVHLADFASAHHHLRQALDLYCELDDGLGQAHVQLNLGFALEREGRHPEALERNLAALRLYLATGHRVGEARARNSVGWSYARLGDYQRALGYCQEALELHHLAGNRYGEAATMDSIGFAHHHLGEYRQAIARYQTALALTQELGDRSLEAEIRVHTGDTHLAAGEPEAARAAWRQALSILEDLEHPDAEGVRDKLAG
jgi:DNA-binding SARP family transcriptional activator/tetratricopeptide (TPR) repeat protein